MVQYGKISLCGISLLSVAERSPFSIPKTGFDCQSQPKGFMRLDEEAQKAEERILQHAQRMEDVPTLKRILREGLAGFEQALDALSPQEREAALSLYLDKIRKITFGFHFAIFERSARAEFFRNPTRERMQAILARSAEDMDKIASLYRFI
jgi:hypothetical protein